MSDNADEIALSANADINVRSKGPNADTKSLPERLALAIDGAGGQLAVARLIGVSSKTLSRYRAGAPPKHSTLDAIARATGVRLEWLASGEGPMRPGDPPAGATEPAAKPQEAAPQPPATPLFLRMNMDYLVDAYEVAFEHLSKGGTHKPDSRRLMQVTMLFYEELLEAAERGEIPTEPLNKD